MKTEVLRKIFHLIFGLIFLILIYFFGTTISLQIIITLFLIGLLLAILILKGYKNKKIDYILEIVERNHEKHFPGKAALIFFFSVIILLFFFIDYPIIVIASFGIIIFADSFAAIIGKKIGNKFLIKKNNYKKTLEGSLTFFIITFFWILMFFPIQIALICAIIATIIEILPINDNITIPIIIAFLLKIMI